MPGCQGLEQTRHASLQHVLVQRTLVQPPGRDTVGREVIASATVCRGPARHSGLTRRTVLGSSSCDGSS